MTQASEHREGVLQELSGEAALSQLAELATEFGAEQIASTARSIAERISEGRFYVACIGQFKRGKSTLLNALIGSFRSPHRCRPGDCRANHHSAR
jgi:ribosome biogenesis GTPase A